MSDFKSIQVYDLVSIGPRLWEVVGVYIGALHYEFAETEREYQAHCRSTACAALAAALRMEGK